MSSANQDSSIRDQVRLGYSGRGAKPLMEKKCHARKNIVFIKTLKTGGSTLSNILSRFAMKHNIFIPSSQLRKFVGLQNKPSGKFNLIQSHILYNRTYLSDVMPNETIYVTQLRHPLKQFVSMLNHKRIHNVTDPLKHYPIYFEEQQNFLEDSWIQLSIPKNVSDYELQLHLKQLERQFDLITITEQFDLSLLLLRRKLCWDISDMLYIPLKIATYKFNRNFSSSNIQHDQILNERFKTLNPNSYRLYNYFNRTLWDMIIKAGQDLQDELSFFQELNSNVSKYCSKYIKHIIQNSRDFLNLINSSKVLDIPASRWGTAHTVDSVECAMMKLHRRTFSSIPLIRKLDPHLIERMKHKNTPKWLRALAQPIHPKYGIPLPVLTLEHAYDILPEDK